MIELSNFTVRYGTRVLLGNVSATVPRGSLCALIGVNGSGKSTLLRRVAGLDKGYTGTISVAGNDISVLSRAEIARTISLVTTSRVRVNNITCREIVALGRAPYTNWIGSKTVEDRLFTEKAIEMAGIKEYAGRMISTLSDGEAQRVMIARAIAQDTPVILLDEPTSFLDLPGRYRLVALLKELAGTYGKTILFSTHELEIAARSTDLTLIIDTPDLITAPSDKIIPNGIIRRVFGIF